MNLSIGYVFLREKHYAKLAHDSVEGSVRERKRGSVGRLEGYLFAGPELRPRHLKHWRVEISCRQMHAGGRKSRNWRVPVPAAVSSTRRTAGGRSARDVGGVVDENHGSQTAVVVLRDVAAPLMQRDMMGSRRTPVQMRFCR